MNRSSKSRLVDGSSLVMKESNPPVLAKAKVVSVEVDPLS